MKKIIYNLFKDSLLKNSIYLIITSFLGSIFAFIFWIFAARYYKTDELGIASALFSNIMLISMIGSIGLPRAIIFYLPRSNDIDKIINSCLIVSIISSIIFSLIFILGLKIWTPGLITILDNLKNILIFISITVATSVSVIIGAVFTAGRKSSYQMVKETIYHFIKIFPLFLFASLGVFGMLLSIGIGTVISVIIGFILLIRIWKYSPRFHIDPIIKNMASFSAGNHIANILYNFPILILPVLMLDLASAKSAGYFYISIMMASLLYGVSQSVSNSLLVESSDNERFNNNVDKAIKFSLVITIPGVLLLTILGKLILNIFNHDYALNATTTMIILSGASIPISLVNIFNTVRNAQNRVISTIKMNLLITSITLILSIPLIKIMNIEGAAISYLIANMVGAFIVVNRIKNSKKYAIKDIHLIRNIEEKIKKK